MWSAPGVGSARERAAHARSDTTNSSIESAVGLTLTAIFPGGPITTSPDEATETGKMHALAAMIGIPSLPIAAELISFSLRRNPAWAHGRRALLWAANLTWISLA